MTTETNLLTADDLLRLHSEGVRGELIRGVLVERQSGGIESGMIIAEMGRQIGEALRRDRLGTGTIGSGYWLERQPDTVREAQVAFISTERLPRDRRVTGYAETAPHLVVEVQGFNRGFGEVYDRARMWLSFGVRLVWVVQPETRSVEVHRSGQPVETVAEDEHLDGIDVLPGFSCTVASIFGS